LALAASMGDKDGGVKGGFALNRRPDCNCRQLPPLAAGVRSMGTRVNPWAIREKDGFLRSVPSEAVDHYSGRPYAYGPD